MEKHEKNVENFYTTGSRIMESDISKLEHPHEGFLSFGYWENAADTYVDATKRLLRYFIDNSGIENAGRILNVACGFGTESFEYFKKFNPSELIGIDITKVHIDYANLMSKKLGLEKKVKFVHGDAVELNFPDNHFSHILGIEGPAHFRTREKFFTSANRVLEKGGELILTDIILGNSYHSWNPIHEILLRIGAKMWVVPIQNKVNEQEYRKQLENAGFEVVFLEKIGGHVFPGYSNSFSTPLEKNFTKRLGFFTSIGMHTIARTLGYLYKKGLIEYIFVKARKL